MNEMNEWKIQMNKLECWKPTFSTFHSTMIRWTQLHQHEGVHFDFDFNVIYANHNQNIQFKHLI